MKIKQKNTIDMTHGTLWNKLLLFALPLAASSILQQLFNSVDTAVVGRFASSRALAAVGSNSSLIALMINLFIGISLGSNVIISRYIGQKAEEHVKGAIHTAIVVALCSGIFVLVLGQFIARPVLTLMGTPKDVLDLAVLYLRIYFLGMPFIMLYDFSSSILRSIGDSRRPLYALIAAGIINTGLNLILVIVFHLGVSGVAIATVVSNIVSSGILFYILLHEQEPIRVSLSGLSIDWGELKKILIIGVPAGLQGMVFSLANVCIQSMINSFGSNAIAGSAAALNFEFFAYFMVNAFAQTTVTFTSQNYGAGDFQRCKKVYRLCMIFSVIFCGLLSGIFVLGRDFFLRLYTTDPNVLTFAVQRLLIVTTLELLTSTYEISGGDSPNSGKQVDLFDRRSKTSVTRELNRSLARLINSYHILAHLIILSKGESFCLFDRVPNLPEGWTNNPKLGRSRAGCRFNGAKGRGLRAPLPECTVHGR